MAIRKPHGRKAKRRHQTQPEAVNFDEVKNDNQIELDAIKECRNRTKLWRILIIVACVCAPISLLICMGNTATIDDAVTEAQAVNANMTVDKPGKNAALQSINTWLTGSNSPFPSGTSNLTWDGAQKTSDYMESSGDSSVSVQTWVHTFSFTDSTGSVRRVTQNTMIRDNVANAVGTPSILPEDPTTTSSSNEGNSAPQGYRSLDNASQLDALVTTWAKSYVGKDVSAFTVLVADPDTNHVYQPANVGTFDNAAINWGVWQDQNADGENNGTYAVLNVTITFKPYATTNTSADDQSQHQTQSASTELNLLVSNPTLGSAKIVDWGGSGQVSNLEPYANALPKSIVNSASSSGSDDTDPDATASSGDDSQNSEPTADATSGETASEEPQE